jgi:acetyltransferase-like isoleucine patch superfamily enzyme
MRICKPRMIWGYKTPDGKFLKNVRISSSTFIDHRKHLFIEDHVFIGHFNFIEASNNVIIGEGCQITNFITITTHSSHLSLRLYGIEYINHPNPIGYEKGSVEIGKYSFIGPHSVIMSDSAIGKGSLVAAYSLVKGSFPDFSVIRGNPAKVVGDTREMDRQFLNKHPELRSFYEAWSQDKS